MMVWMAAGTFAAAGQRCCPALSGADSARSVGVDSREFNHHRQPFFGVV
jgi:hypothetical protein